MASERYARPCPDNIDRARPSMVCPLSISRGKTQSAAAAREKTMTNSIMGFLRMDFVSVNQVLVHAMAQTCPMQLDNEMLARIPSKVCRTRAYAASVAAANSDIGMRAHKREREREGCVANRAAVWCVKVLSGADLVRSRSRAKHHRSATSAIAGDACRSRRTSLTFLGRYAVAFPRYRAQNFTRARRAAVRSPSAQGSQAYFPGQRVQFLLSLDPVVQRLAADVQDNLMNHRNSRL